MDKAQLKQIFGQTPDIMTLLALVLLLCCITPYIKNGNMLIDTISNFLFQYAILALVLMIVAVAMKMAGAIVFLLPALVLCAIQLAPMLVYSTPSAALGTPVSILQANVLKTTTETQGLRTLITVEKPDVIILAETTSVHRDLLRDLESLYPYQQVADRGDASSFGMVVLSRLPVADQDELAFDTKDIPALRLTITAGQDNIDILSLHPMNPLKNIQSRNNELTAVGNYFAQAPVRHLVIAGDMNATPYSGLFRKSMQKAGVSSARIGNGIVGTYPAWLPTSILRLPIDHAMVSDSIAVIDFRAGDDIGSDHLPTITDIAVRK